MWWWADLRASDWLNKEMKAWTWKPEEVELSEHPSSWHSQTVCLIPRELLCKLMTRNPVEDLSLCRISNFLHLSWCCRWTVWFLSWLKIEALLRLPLEWQYSFPQYSFPVRTTYFLFNLKVCQHLHCDNKITSRFLPGTRCQAVPPCIVLTCPCTLAYLLFS